MLRYRSPSVNGSCERALKALVIHPSVIIPRANQCFFIIHLCVSSLCSCYASSCYNTSFILSPDNSTFWSVYCSIPWHSIMYVPHIPFYSTTNTVLVPHSSGQVPAQPSPIAFIYSPPCFSIPIPNTPYIPVMNRGTVVVPNSWASRLNPL